MSFARKIFYSIRQFNESGCSDEISADTASALLSNVDDYFGKPFNCGRCEISRYENNIWWSDNEGTRSMYLNHRNVLDIDIWYNKSNGNHCPHHNDIKACANAIRHGECKDEFMRKVVGETLFKDKYTKQR